MLEISVYHKGKTRCIKLYGDLDMESIRTLEQAAEPRQEDVLEIDLGGVAFIDSTGLHGLLAIYRSWQKRQGRVTLLNLKPEVEEVFRLVGLSDLLEVSIAPPFQAGGNG